MDALHGSLVEFEQRRSEVSEDVSKAAVEMFELKQKEQRIKEQQMQSDRGGSWFYGKAREVSLFGNVFKAKEETELSAEDEARKQELLQILEQTNVPKGLYLYGGPGSGKTYLMELLYQSLPVEGKRRVHFHEFMLEVHRTLHSLQKEGYSGDEMMIKCVNALHEQAWVLCFDEFQVTDIADAMVMRRLFENLWLKGMVIVATSNRSPDDLYKNGIQRDLFVPFIGELQQFCDVEHITSEIDYRMTIFDAQQQALQANHEETVFFVKQPGTGIRADAKFERLWDKWTKGDVVHTTKLRVQGREIRVPLAARYDDIARFEFDDLCGKPLGPGK